MVATRLLPFKGRIKVGMGLAPDASKNMTHPHPNLPLEGEGGLLFHVVKNNETHGSI